MAEASHSDTTFRTPLSLAIKTLTTHFCALATYTYLSALHRRRTKSHIQAARCIFFLFVPTLVLVELLVTFSRALVQFLRNYENDEDDENGTLHLRFYLSAGLGTCAREYKSDEGEGKDIKGKSIPLLDVGSHCAEKEIVPLSWAWVGKMLAIVFSLTQAVGTIVMWVRRMESGQGDALSFDHRNGAMGIASATCGVACVLTLLLRLEWKVSKAFEVPQKETGYFRTVSKRNQFVVEALLAMMLHLTIATAANEDNIWLYSSMGSIAFLFAGQHDAAPGWQAWIFIVFLYIFRHDIMRKLGVDPSRYVQFFGAKKMARARALLGFLVVLWMAVDVVWLFVADIVQVVRMKRQWWYWWQDPLSDSLIVI